MGPFSSTISNPASLKDLMKRLFSGVNKSVFLYLLPYCATAFTSGGKYFLYSSSNVTSSSVFSPVSSSAASASSAYIVAISSNTFKPRSVNKVNNWSLSFTETGFSLKSIAMIVFPSGAKNLICESPKSIIFGNPNSAKVTSCVFAN